MYQRWTVSVADTETVKTLSEECGIDAVTARIAAARGLTTPELLNTFLSEDEVDFNPHSLSGITECAKVILSAIDIY